MVIGVQFCSGTTSAKAQKFLAILLVSCDDSQDFLNLSGIAIQDSSQDSANVSGTSPRVAEKPMLYV